FCRFCLPFSSFISASPSLLSHFFSFTAPAPTQISTLSLHDALPISGTPGPTGQHPVPAAGRRNAPDAGGRLPGGRPPASGAFRRDRKSTRLNSSHVSISYAVFCLKKKKRRKYS